MALTDSLDAATQQVLALLQQLRLSNVRTVQAQDTGPADSVTLTPTPAITAYGPDLLVLTDINFPNATTTPHLAISGLAPIPITASTNSPVKIGAVAGKCLFGLSSSPAGGFVARLLIAIPEGVLGSGEGVAVGAGAVNLDTLGLAEEDVLSGSDLFVFFQTVAEGGIGPGHHRRTTFAVLAASVLATVGITGSLDAVYAHKLTAGSLAAFALTARQFISDNALTVANLAGANPSWGSIANGVFTVGQDGFYLIRAGCTLDVNASSSATAFFTLEVDVDGAVVLSQTSNTPMQYYATATIAGGADIAWLRAGQAISLRGYIHASQYDAVEASFLAATLKIGKIG